MLQNYESVKLMITHPDYVNICFWIIILSFVCMHGSFRQNSFMDLQHTVQLKGIAILFVVVGHFWIHVVESTPRIVLSGSGVTIFLIVSGYGVSTSYLQHQVNFKKFMVRRLCRILPSYYLTTILIISADYLYLHRTISVQSFLETIIGLNITVETQYLDYVRWFITYILFWYIIFYISSQFARKTSLKIMFLISTLLFLIDYYFVSIGWYQFFAFPTGCLFAYYKNEIQYHLSRIDSLLTVLGLLLVVSTLAIKYTETSQVETLVPKIIIVGFGELSSLIFSIGLILLFTGYKNIAWSSKILTFLGKYSYEIFLLHGPLMIKYSIINSSPLYIYISILGYLIGLLFLACILSAVSMKLSNSMSEYTNRRL